MGVLKARVNGAWEEVAGAVAEPPLDEVWVGQERPDPVGTHEVWYDTSTEPGVLKVKRESGEWETASSGSEVAVSDTDPYTADPTATDELWFDTTTSQLWYRATDPTPHWRPAADIPANEVFVGLDEPTPDVELWYDPAAVATLGPREIPPGGLTHQALTKRTDQDGEVEWSGPHLKLSGGVMTGPIDMNGSDIDRSGNIDFNGGKKIQFPNETVPKINYYADTFGVGIEGGTQTLYASSRVRFRVGTPVTAGDPFTIPEVASVDAAGFIHGGVWVPTLKVINNVALVVGHWYEISTVNYHRTVRVKFGAIGPGKPTRAQSLDGNAALFADAGEGVSEYSGYLTIFGHIKGSQANNKLFSSIGVGPEKLWIKCSQAATVQVGIEAYDTASGGRTTLSFADAGTAPGVWNEVAL